MKVVVAVDSFKGKHDFHGSRHGVKAGVLAAHKDAEVIVKPLADGGEGTTDALIEGLNENASMSQLPDLIMNRSTHIMVISRTPTLLSWRWLLPPGSRSPTRKIP